MKQRVITAAIALAIFLPALYFGGLALEVLVIAMTGVGLYEFLRMKGMKILSLPSGLTAVGAFSIIFSKAPITLLPQFVDLYYLYFLAIMLLLSLTVFQPNSFTIEDAGFLSLVSLYLGVGFSGILMIRAISFGMVIFVFSLIWGTDIFAYLVGRQIGKHKLAPLVSPNKTIEGALGGVVGAIVFGLIVLAFYNPLRLSNLQAIVLITGISVFGQLGDLTESAYKRHFGVKDSGKLLPGHGGILDRFDSTFFAMFIFQIVLSILTR